MSTLPPEKPETPISRTEFAAFARVVQNALNAMDTAIREAFEHLSSLRDGIDSLDTVKEKLTEAEASRDKLEKAMGDLRTEFDEEKANNKSTQNGKVHRLLIGIALLSASVSAMLTLLIVHL
jgi:uncharacterized protein Yka (UPF0111/DUF47 family)